MSHGPSWGDLAGLFTTKTMVKVKLNIVTTDGDQLAVRLRHPPRPNKVASLGEELSENGWEGRPVILAEHHGHIHALTGSVIEE